MAVDPRSYIPESRTDYTPGEILADPYNVVAAALNDIGSKINEILAVFVAKNLIVKIPE